MQQGLDNRSREREKRIKRRSWKTVVKKWKVIIWINWLGSSGTKPNDADSRHSRRHSSNTNKDDCNNCCTCVYVAISTINITLYSLLVCSVWRFVIVDAWRRQTSEREKEKPNKNWQARSENIKQRVYTISPARAIITGVSVFCARGARARTHKQPIYYPCALYMHSSPHCNFRRCRFSFSHQFYTNAITLRR